MHKYKPVMNTKASVKLDTVRKLLTELLISMFTYLILCWNIIYLKVFSSFEKVEEQKNQKHFKI